MKSVYRTGHKSCFFRTIAVQSILWTVCGLQAGELNLSVVDASTDEPVTVRMHLENRRGATVRPRGTLRFADFFIVQGSTTLDLNPGNYAFTIERGPEYRGQRGHFVIERNGKDSRTLTMHRIADLAAEGWWSGDLLASQPARNIPIMMDAEDLKLVCNIPPRHDTTQADAADGRLVMRPNIRLKHPGGDVLLAGHADRSVEDGQLLELIPSVSERLKTLPETVHVSVLRPYAWHLPVWMTVGRVDSIVLLHGNLRRTGLVNDELRGRPRDQVIYPAPHGNARWSQDIYFHLLNTGLQIPPVAASESGLTPNPLGYNRVYVQCGEHPQLPQDWWEGLRAGKVFVTNGPLLRADFNDQPPGTIFRAPKGDSVTIESRASLASKEKIRYLQIIQDGVVAHDLRLADLQDNRGRLPDVTFDRSGWMLLRVVTSAEDTYRCACTGPIYVRIEGTPIARPASTKFFLDWVYARARALNQRFPEAWKTLQSEHRRARDFWAQLPAPDGRLAPVGERDSSTEPRHDPGERDPHG